MGESEAEAGKKLVVVCIICFSFLKGRGHHK